MDNAQKAIMIGVGLFITIIVIAAVMLITGMGQDMLTSGQQQVSNISSSLQAQITSDFDGTTVTGAQVISAVKRYYTDENMVIVVNATTTHNADPSKNHHYGKIRGTNITGKHDTGYVADGIEAWETGKTPKKIGTLTDTSSSNKDYYVPNSAKYYANVIRIKGTDTVVGIFFERKI